MYRKAFDFGTFVRIYPRMQRAGQLVLGEIVFFITRSTISSRILPANHAQIRVLERVRMFQAVAGRAVDARMTKQDDARPL